MTEYLAFVDLIGVTTDGDFIYRFDFTENTDVVWGDYFNVAPAIIVPDLQPDINCLSMRAKAVFPREMVIAKKNSCFSMQDCIDGIIDMMFSEIDDETLEIDDCPFSLKFGEEMESVIQKLDKVGISFFETEEINNARESAIDDLINSIDDDNNEIEDDM